MPMLTTLDLPEAVPEWASDPALTNVDKPPKGIQVSGVEAGKGLPAVWFNWLQKMNYEWAQKVASVPLMNWHESAIPTMTSIVRSAMYHPGIGRWVIVLGDTNTRYSVDGDTWTTGGVVVAGPTARQRPAIDTTRFIFPCLTDLSYSITGIGPWTTIASATIGGSGNIYAVHTKYPDSDFIMLCRGTGTSLTVRRSITGVNGTWVAASTQPPSVPANGIGRCLVYVSGTTWLLLVNYTVGTETVLYRSLDDGDTWTTVSGLTYPATSSGGKHMAYNHASGRLVMVGSAAASGAEEEARYSDDLGDSWTQATINKNGIAGSAYLAGVYYCGGSAWVAVGLALSPSTSSTVFVSTDDGENWRVVDIHGSTMSSANVLACDGRKVIGFSDNDACLRSDSI